MNNKDDILAQIYELDFKISEAEKLTSDPEMSSLAYEEIANLKKEKANLESQIDTSQYAQQSYDEKPEAGSSLDTRNAIIEVKGAAGGDEANIDRKSVV